jgi:hypothetical protein
MANVLKQRLLEEMEKLKDTKRERDITVWDAFLEVAKGQEHKYILTLKADILVLEKFANGLSIKSVVDLYGSTTKHISGIARLWQFEPLDTTLDFNPMLVYEFGMKPETLMAEINEILAIPITLDTARKIVYNIEQYRNALLFLEDVDDN